MSQLSFENQGLKIDWIGFNSYQESGKLAKQVKETLAKQIKILV